MDKTKINIDAKSIRDEANYEKALARTYELMQLRPELNTPEGDELDMLVTLIEAYEEIHYPMASINPKHKMEQKNLKQKDLIPFIGDKTKVSKILSGKQELTISMIRNLAKGLNIPVQRLIDV